MNNIYPLCACDSKSSYNAQQLASYGEKEKGEETFEAYLGSLTPAKKKVAMTAVGLYLRDTFKRNTGRQIFSSGDVYGCMHPLLANKRTEEFWVMFLNIRNRVIGIKRMSGGGMTCTLVDVRMVMREALLCGATVIIAVHNHPSGCATPSREDDDLTKALVNAAKTLNITLRDHVIFTESKYYSYSDEGKI